jgi:hypothetical protein
VKVVVVTGSRYLPWSAAPAIQEVLRGADLLIVGGAPGADTIAERVAESVFVPVLKCRANWALHGPGAGPIRNGVMVKFARVFKLAGHEVICYAFPLGASPGTRGCIKLMHDAGIEVLVNEG